MSIMAVAAVVVLCLALQAFFAGSEIALISCDKIRMKTFAGRGSRSAKLVLRSYAEIDRFLGTTLAGINIALITSTILLTFYLEEHVGDGAELYSVLILSPLIVVFGQVVPKSVFRRNSDSLILWAIYPLWVATKIFLPLTWFVNFFTRLALRYAGHRSAVTRGEIMDAITAHERDGGGEKRRMLRRVFSFSEVTVGDIMVPLSSVRALDENATVSEATELVRSSGYTRIPLYRGRIDKITGVLHSFFLLRGRDARAGTNVAEFSSPALFVTERKPASELLEDMKAGRDSMAVVVDEYSGAVGIVTIEDIVEEIVGEIEDEHDKDENLWVKTGADEYLVFPHISVERINRDLGIRIPEDGGYETLGGFLLSRFKCIPSLGQTLEAGGAIFTVESATSRAIKRVKVTHAG